MRTPSDNLRDRVLAFLKQHKTMVLTTLAPDGSPYTMPLTYYIDDTFTFYFTTPKPSRKYTHMCANKNVSVLVYDDSNAPTSVTVRGTVHEITDPVAARRQMAEIVNRVWQESPFVPTSFRLKKQFLTVMEIKPVEMEWFQDRILDLVIEKETVAL